MKKANHHGKVQFGIDPASSEFFNPASGKYNLAFKEQALSQNVEDKYGHALLGRDEMKKLYMSLLDRYPIVLLEDPFAEDDWDSWSSFNKICPVELVGDDLLATNVHRIELAHERKACNSLLLKINQIGSISEAIAA